MKSMSINLRGWQKTRFQPFWQRQARQAWMSQKYPEIRSVESGGRRQPHKLRQNYCPSSPIYREKVRQINTLLAERYAEHPALLLWHISNEYGNHGCRRELCLQAFRAWLQARYGSLDALNQAWWTTFWAILILLGTKSNRLTLLCTDRSIRRPCLIRIGS